MKLGVLNSYVGSNIEPFDLLFDKSTIVLSDDDVQKCDAILLWGGEDIWPGYYDEHPHIKNQNPGYATARDQREWSAMMAALKHGVPIIGVCRGAQFLCAFAGGKLIQHCTGHHHTHRLMVASGPGWQDDQAKIHECKLLTTSSEHHQMLYCDDMPKDTYEILGWAPGLSKVYQSADGDIPTPPRGFFIEPEAVWFPKVRGFAIQGHPEWMNPADDYVLWCMDMIDRLLLKEKASVLQAG